MIRTILVPLDGSSFGEHALPMALRLAQRSGARLELVHVHVHAAPEPDVEGLTPYHFEHVVEHDHAFDEEAFRADEQALERLATQLTREHPVAVEPRVLRGPVGPVLHRHAEALRADLVVMATHGRGGLSRSWLGSVADYLVRHASMPVLLVRPEDGASAPLAPPHDVRRILVPLDGSPFSEQILSPVVELTAQTGARLTLVRVLTPLLRYGVPPADLDAPEVLEERERAEEYLDAVAAQLAYRLQTPEVLVVRHPRAATAIIDEAAERKVDLIAMASHGRGGVARLLLGSTADKVVRGTHTPVLLYRPQGAP